MSEILENYTEFGKIKDIYDSVHDKQGLFEFLNNVVMNDDIMDENNTNGYGIMLKDLSDIYVLVSNKDFPFDKISHKNIKLKLKNGKKNYVLGYIWLCPWIIKNPDCIPYHFISYIDSRISGLNIAKYMINAYEFQDKEKGQVNLLPFEIALSSKNYWKKYFTDEYKVNNKTELKNMVNNFKLKDDNIRWNKLMSVY
tara:strand:+ start:124 stop:714 length:591 start_codon:yes stop_codon:yes gene_type:complete